MPDGENGQLEEALGWQSGRVGHDLVVPNPKLKILSATFWLGTLAAAIYVSAIGFMLGALAANSGL